jgi:hypothetical protein
VAAAAIRNSLKRIGVGRPDRKAREHQKTEQYSPNFAITNPDSLIHVSPISGYDLFSGHRLPPFFQTGFFSFLNEPPFKGRTHGGDLSPAGATYSHFAG